MFIPLWVFGAIAAAYLMMGLVHCASATVSGPKLPGFREYLLCLFLWPLFHIR